LSWIVVGASGIWVSHNMMCQLAAGIVPPSDRRDNSVNCYFN